MSVHNTGSSVAANTRIYLFFFLYILGVAVIPCFAVWHSLHDEHLFFLIDEEIEFTFYHGSYLAQLWNMDLLHSISSNSSSTTSLYRCNLYNLLPGSTYPFCGYPFFSSPSPSHPPHPSVVFLFCFIVKNVTWFQWTDIRLFRRLEFCPQPP